MSSFTPQMSILPLAQKKLWPMLAPSVTMSMVLYGGTAVALRLGHRQSIDFNFFTEQNLDRNALANSFTFLATSTTLQDEPNTFTVRVPPEDDPVLISFFGGIDCGRVEEPDLTADGTLLVASPLDLLAHKLKVILLRSAAKDYQDIAALLRSGENLQKGLAATMALWPSYQPAVGVKALTFFGDGDLETLAEKDKELLVKEAGAVGELPGVQRTSQTIAPFTT